MELVNPSDSLQRKNEKLLKIVNSLMHRAEQTGENSGLAYAQFERAVLLERQVRERTFDLERVMGLLNETNGQLAKANSAAETAWSNLKEATETITDGMALFDSDDRLVLYNQRFCGDLRDVVGQITIGMTFDAYLNAIGQSKRLDTSKFGGAEGWIKWRKQQHDKRPSTFNVDISDGGLLQVQSLRTTSDSTVILHINVTDIVRLERDRMAEQQVDLLRTTLDHLDQGVCIFEASGNLVGWNNRLETLLLPQKAHDLRDRHISVLIDQLSNRIKPTGHFSFDDLRDWATHKAGRPPITFEVVSSDHTILNVFGQEMPEHGFVLSFSDVTVERETGRSLVQMNEQLELRVRERTAELDRALVEAKRANASKTRFVAAASHDLAQPLSAAKLFITSLADEGADPQVADTVKKAETALQSVEHIIETLLDMSKLDLQSASFDRQSVPVNSVLKALENELRPKAMEKGLDFRVVGCSLVVDTDPGFLRRIAQNLISNAVRYTDHGKILVGVRRFGAVARLEVHDTGRGIDPDEQSIIFEEFRQLDRDRTDTEGLGLGLTIVDRACTALGHHLHLRSQPDFGSCFSVELPIVDTFSLLPNVPTVESPLPGKESISGMIILLVVTDQQLSRAMSMLIEGWGGVVLEVTSQTEALSLLADVDLVPDAMILDGRLKDGETGPDVFDAVKNIHGVLPTRIISADRSEDLLHRCVERQIEIISKPIDPLAIAAFLTEVQTKCPIRHIYHDAN
jgi:two-component system, sensor histidine kinase